MRSHTVPAATLLVALAAFGTARPAVASLDTSVVAATPTRAGPWLVLDPSSNDPHVLYVNGGALMHASRSGGVWTEEVVSAAISNPPRLRGWAVGPSGRLAAAFMRLGDRFVCSVRESGGWVEDSSLVNITPTTSAAFEVDPVTGEPRVAYARTQNPPAGATHVICLASRSGSGWTITEVDSISTASPQVTLGIAPSGKARIGYLDGLTYMVAREDAGGFDREPAVTRRSLLASLAIDPITEEPRVAFITPDSSIAGTDTLLHCCPVQ